MHSNTRICVLLILAMAVLSCWVSPAFADSLPFGNFTSRTSSLSPNFNTGKSDFNFSFNGPEVTLIGFNNASGVDGHSFIGNSWFTGATKGPGFGLYQFAFGGFQGSVRPYCVVTPVPEPDSIMLIGTGLIGLGWKFRRKTSA